MKILARNNALNRMALCICLLSTLSIARGAAQAVPVPAAPESFDMDTSKTASVGGGVQFGEFLGRRAIDLPQGDQANGHFDGEGIPRFVHPMPAAGGMEGLIAR